MKLNSDLLYQIMRWDYGLTLMYYDMTRYPIPLADRTHSFIQYIVRNNRIVLVADTIRRVPIHKYDMIDLFEIAVVYESIDVCRLLCGTLQPTTLFTYCLYAVRENVMRVALLLVDEFISDIGQDGHMLLTTAIKYNRIAFVRHILPRVDDPSNRPFLTAVRLKRHAIIQLLLRHKHIQPHQPNNRAFHIALANSDYWCMNELMNEYRVRRLVLEN